MAAKAEAPVSRRRGETANRAEAVMRLERLAGSPQKIKETDLEVVIRGLKADFLACRDRGHSWPLDDDDIIWTTTRYGNKRREMVCQRCTMIKHQNIRWDGTAYVTWYTPPIGYYLVGQSDRRLGLKVQLVRREILRRKFGEAQIVSIANIMKQRKANDKKRSSR